MALRCSKSLLACAMFAACCLCATGQLDFAKIATGDAVFRGDVSFTALCLRFCLWHLEFAAEPSLLAKYPRSSPVRLDSANASLIRVLRGWMCLQGTYYGHQGGQNDQGTCSYGAARANALDQDWKTGVKTTIALNRPQLYASTGCGLCIMFRFERIKSR